MSDKEVAKSMSFEEKMKDRIKESIGELITDEELSIMVKRGFRGSLFQAYQDSQPKRELL